MSNAFSLLVAVFSILTLGCVSQTAEPIDLEKEKAAILTTDRAWSETPPNAEAFTALFANEPRFLPPDAPQANSKEEVLEMASQMFSLPGFSLEWTANFADVSSAGDLGYSVGTFELTVHDPEGNPVTRIGKYTTVWKKQADGQWKVVSDTFNFDSPA